MLAWIYSAQKKIVNMNWLYFSICIFHKKKVRYKKMLQRSSSRIDRDLDLVRFIVGQRMLLKALNSSFTAKQRFVLNQMAGLYMHDSSDLSKDGALSDYDSAEQFED